MKYLIATVWAGLLALCLIFWLGVASCAMPQANAWQDLTSKAVTGADLTPMMAVRAMTEASHQPEQYATAHVRRMPKLAGVKGGLPIAMNPETRPLAGREFRLRWLTRPVAPRPDLASALLLTLAPPSEPQPIPGGRGAMLQVPPDYVLVPERIEDMQAWSRPGAPFEFVQDAQGQVMLRLLIPSNFAGISIWCQLLVADSRVPAGCVSTPMIELHVGSQ